MEKLIEKLDSPFSKGVQVGIILAAAGYFILTAIIRWLV